MNNALKTITQKHQQIIIDALQEQLDEYGGNTYSDLDYYRNEHKIDEEISKKHCVQCISHNISDNDCYITFLFTDGIKDLNTRFGIMNFATISVSNTTGNSWISSNNCDSVDEWVERTHMKFIDKTSEQNFIKEDYIKEFDQLMLLSLLRA